MAGRVEHRPTHGLDIEVAVGGAVLNDLKRADAHDPTAGGPPRTRRRHRGPPPPYPPSPRTGRPPRRRGRRARAWPSSPTRAAGPAVTSSKSNSGRPVAADGRHAWMDYTHRVGRYEKDPFGRSGRRWRQAPAARSAMPPSATTGTRPREPPTARRRPSRHVGPVTTPDRPRLAACSAPAARVD